MDRQEHGQTQRKSPELPSGVSTWPNFLSGFGTLSVYYGNIQLYIITFIYFKVHFNEFY